MLKKERKKEKKEQSKKKRKSSTTTYTQRKNKKKKKKAEYRITPKVTPNLPIDILKHTASFLCVTDLFALVETSTFWHQILTQKSATPIRLYGFRNTCYRPEITMPFFYRKFCSSFQGVVVRGISLVCFPSDFEMVVRLPFECISITTTLTKAFVDELPIVAHSTGGGGVQHLQVCAEAFVYTNLKFTLPNMRTLIVRGSSDDAYRILKMTTPHNLESFAFSQRRRDDLCISLLLLSLSMHSKSLKSLVFSSGVYRTDEESEWDSKTTFDSLTHFESNSNTIPPPPTRHIISEMSINTTIPRFCFSHHARRLILRNIERDRFEAGLEHLKKMTFDSLIIIDHVDNMYISYSLKEIFTIFPFLNKVAIQTLHGSPHRACSGAVCRHGELFKVEGIVAPLLLSCFGSTLTETTPGFQTALKWHAHFHYVEINGRDLNKNQKEIDSIMNVQSINLSSQKYWTHEISKLVEQRRNSAEGPIKVYLNGRKQEV